MSEHLPWRRDRAALTSTMVRRLAARIGVAAGFDPVALGSGWDSDVWRIAPERVAWLPRRREVAERLAGSIAIGDWFRAGRVAGDPVLGQPDCLHPAGAGFPWVLASGPFVPGVAGDRFAMDEQVPLETRTAIGAWLGRLRARDPAAFPVSASAEPAPGVADRRARLAASADRLVRSDPDLAPAVERLLAEPPPAEPRTAVVVHNDLCPDHVHVDPGNGSLVGILDLDDANIGDPVLDLVGLAGWLGWPALAAVDHGTGMPLTARDRQRLVWSARVLNLAWLDDARRGGGDVMKHRRWVARVLADPESG